MIGRDIINEVSDEHLLCGTDQLSQFYVRKGTDDISLYQNHCLWIHLDLVPQTRLARHQLP